MAAEASFQPIQDGAVHVWHMDLDDTAWDCTFSVLNQEEREKAARFYTEKLQRHYSRCRGALRTILSRYVTEDAAALQFRYGKFGKPELIGFDLHFNLSHSGKHAVFAVSTTDVGVDIELMSKDRMDLSGLINMVCHPTEKAELALLSDAEKLRQFYRLWTQKEAYCKLVGLGLQQAVDVLHFIPTASASIMELQIDNQDGNQEHTPAYFTHRLDIVDGYAGSLCLCMPPQATTISLFAATPS